MKFGSVCSGHDAVTQALHDEGWVPAFFAEIEAFPCGVLAHRLGGSAPRVQFDPSGLPEAERRQWEANNREIDRMAQRGVFADWTVPNLGDFTRIDPAEWGDVEWLWGGTPCFPAGVQIATETGFRSVEDVRVGDRVLTHAGRFRPVTAVGSKTAATWRLRGQGHPDMVTTANHPFLSRQRQGRSTRVGGKPVALTWWTDRAWTSADQMAGKHWAMPTTWPALPVPAPDVVGNEKAPSAISADLLWIAGAYVGDGWVRSSDRRGAVIFGLNPEKEKIVAPRLRALGLSFARTEARTTIKLHVQRRGLARWLAANFGSGAGEKRIPQWLLGASPDLREAFVAGYAATDGSVSASTPWVAMSGLTVSRRLALGMRMLGISLGYAVTVHRHVPPPTTMIEGRTVRQRPQWTFRFSTSTRTSVAEADVRWSLVRRSEPTGETDTVYDLTVAEDHSYVADGIVVHNCQAFSVAGARQGLKDHRGNLTLAFVGLAHELAAAGSLRGFTWENVPGILSDKKNAFGCFLGAVVGHDSPIVSPHLKGRWTDSGVVAGPLGVASWRVLDTQFFGLPQRRRRVFVVASFDPGLDPVRILLEPAGLRGSSPAGARQGEDLAGTVTASFGSRSAEGAERGTLVPAAADDEGVGAGLGLRDVRVDQSALEPAGVRMVRGGGSGGRGAESGDLAPTLAGGARREAGYSLDDLPLIGVPHPEPVAGTLSACGGTATKHGYGYGDADLIDGHQAIPISFPPQTAHTLRADGFDASEDGTGRGTPILPVLFSAMPMNSGKDFKVREVEVAQPVVAAGVALGHMDFESETFIAEPLGFNARQDPDVWDGRTGPLDTDGFTQAVCAPIPRPGDPAGSLAAAGHPPCIAFSAKDSGNDAAYELAPTLRAGGFTTSHENGGIMPAIAFSLRGRDGENEIEPEAGQVAPALRTGDGGSSKSFVAAAVDSVIWAVRRLMPIETERLQGTADDFTRIPWRGKPAEECPDGPRYKVIGNSMSVNVIRFIGRRIRAEVERAEGAARGE